MRTITEHRAAALALATPLPTVTVGLDDADGHVLAEQVTAPTDLPRWDNSAMDGYAVRHQDVADATAQSPVTLTVLADLPAGSDAVPTVGPGTAARIMTGAPVPPGADSIVPVERTDAGTTTVRIDTAPSPGAHIRRSGEDVHTGDVVLPAGVLLGAAQVAAAASVGRAELRVHRRPRVAVVSTGSELVPPGEPLRRGQIPDSNSYLLASAVRAAGAVPVRVGTVADDATEVRDLLDRLAGSVDAIVTSGGVSMGAYDTVKEVLSTEAGMEFVQVAMQPGKPQGIGRLADGTPVLALPGNPVSSLVSFEVFVRPALQRMRGLTDVDRPEVAGVVVEGWRTPPARTQYMPVAIEEVPHGSADDGVAGTVRIRPAVVGGSGSHLVAGLARAQGFAVVEAEVDRVEPGDMVRVMRTDR